MTIIMQTSKKLIIMWN